MRLPKFQFFEPESLEEALETLSEYKGDGKILSGGTDLLPSLKQRLLTPKVVISLTRIEGLNFLEFDEKNGLKVGALVNIRTLEKDSDIRTRYPIINQAAGAIAAGQLRHMGTVGGNLCLDTRCYYYNQSDFWRSCRPTCIKMGGDTCNAIGGGKKCFAVFSGDLAPALIALGAKVTIRSAQGKRVIALDDLYTGDGAWPISLKEEEILTEVLVPPVAENTYTRYMKYRIRKAIDYPIAGLGAKIEMDRADWTCREARLVVGGVGTGPQLLAAVSEGLRGNKIDDGLVEEASEMAFKQVKPVANTAGTPSYRRLMVKHFVKQALEQASAMPRS